MESVVLPGTPQTNQHNSDFSKMESAVMMISRSGDIFSKICRISYQHSTTDTNQV